MPGPRSILQSLLIASYLASGVMAINHVLAEEPKPVSTESEAADREFFEKRIRPVLASQCYECHNSTADAAGKLALDHRAAMLAGGEGGPIIVPGKPTESRLLESIRHEISGLEMPQDRAKLSPEVIADFEQWIAKGAYDPRDKAPTAEELAQSASSEEALEVRRAWWSLQPLVKAEPPVVQNKAWSDHPVDRFILAQLEAKELSPAPDANKHTLLRRVTFALTGLPPTRAEAEAFLSDSAPGAYERVVDRLLASPHFGERWARHWMDVVHYSDTHGYEWDTPAKNAWMYRDYLVRAINSDIPFKQMILEQLAGDLLPPRIDPASGLNEALIGPMALRLGERRHGDSAAAEGTTQETMANIIDTVSKGFLGTTIACAQCHDHKFDAIPQTDYYSLAGVFMSTRWSVRCADAVDPNVTIIEELRKVKAAIRAELAYAWLGAKESIAAKLLALPEVAPATIPAFPTTLTELWHKQISTPLKLAAYKDERDRRHAANQTNLKLWADFSAAERPDSPASGGWQWEGFGMQHGLVRDGEPVISLEGDTAVAQLLPAGRWSHVWSPRLAGALRSPLMNSQDPVTFSVEYAGGKYSARAFIIDQSFHCERMGFLNQLNPSWLSLTAGNFDRLAGGIDTIPRRVYWELVTKSLNNYFPPRTGYGGVSEAEAADPRSWFGVSRIYQHGAGQGPQDEMVRFEPLVIEDASAVSKADWSNRFAEHLLSSVKRWSESQCTKEDVVVLNEALGSGWLTNKSTQSSELAKLVAQYRELETQLQPNRTVGSAADWHEAKNERIGIRGSYVDFGAEVPRGEIRMLTGHKLPAEGTTSVSSERACGRLELAQKIASDANPLTARVYVNRVWLRLFGEGLVRTPDDFGHLGDRPADPALLDYLATEFIQRGWSLKAQVKLLVTSRTWKQSSQTNPAAELADPENRLWHHRPLLRLDAESIRDSLLAVSGRLDPTIGGLPIDPHRAAEDAAKRLFSGPLDGAGRRSIYLKMTLMEPPKFLAIFNQPIPKLTTGKRDTTNVPDQALAMLNDPFVAGMAKYWSERLMKDGSSNAATRAENMLYSAFARPPRTDEIDRLVQFVEKCTKLRSGDVTAAHLFQPAWQDAAHALFNAKEFVYVD